MEDPDEILNKNAETYRKKNADYGDSWRLAGETLSLWLRHAGLEELAVPTDPDTMNSIGLFTRRLDKLIRAFNAEFVVDELNYESTQDAHEDDSTYAAMHAALLAEQETVTFENADDVTLNLRDPEDMEPVPTSIAFQAEEEDDEYETDGGEPTTGNPNLSEDDYDEALPIDPAYQAEYERRTEDDE